MGAEGSGNGAIRRLTAGCTAAWPKGVEAKLLKHFGKNRDTASFAGSAGYGVELQRGVNARESLPKAKERSVLVLSDLKQSNWCELIKD
jgi:hypothetical protein